MSDAAQSQDIFGLKFFDQSPVNKIKHAIERLECRC